MHCNGKCQMDKKVKEQESKDQKDPLKTFKYSEAYAIQTAGFSAPQFFPVRQEKEPVPLRIGHTADYTTSLFHPPNRA